MKYIVPKWLSYQDTFTTLYYLYDIDGNYFCRLYHVDNQSYLTILHSTTPYLIKGGNDGALQFIENMFKTTMKNYALITKEQVNFL